MYHFLYFNTVKKRIQRLVFPNGFYINPYSRQYLTPDVNSLFRVTSELSRVSEDVKKKFPTDLSEESVSVHYSDQLSNFRIIPDYLKVVGFIEEMEVP